MNDFLKAYKEQKEMEKIKRILIGIGALFVVLGYVGMILFYIALYGGIIYVLYHFITKYW